MNDDMNNDMAQRSWNDLYALKSQQAAQNPSPENLRQMNDVGNITRSFNNSDDQ